MEYSIFGFCVLIKEKLGYYGIQYYKYKLINSLNSLLQPLKTNTALNLMSAFNLL